MMMGKGEVAMHDNTAIFNTSGEHVANIGFDESFGLWQIVVVEREEIKFLCSSKEVTFAVSTNSIPRPDSHDRVDPRAPMPDRGCVLTVL
jgi:hypothetical protein